MSHSVTRIRIVSAVFLIAFGVIIIRLFTLMILDHEKYSLEANRQHFNKRQLVAKRGSIYFSDNSPLAINASTYMMFAVPAEMTDTSDVNKKLRKKLKELILREKVDLDSEKKKDEDSKKKKEDVTPSVSPVPSIEEEEEKDKIKIFFPSSIHSLKRALLEQGGNWQDKLDDALEKSLDDALADKKNQYAQIVTKLTDAQKKDFESLHLPGIHFEMRQDRIYPEGSLAAHVLGIVGKDSAGNDIGYFGLEGFYDGYLAGKSGYEFSERDIDGRPIPNGRVTESKPIDGRDLVLTLKRGVQYIVEKKLKEGVEKYGAQNGTVIVMDPNSGEVLAMASFPTFSPAYWVDELTGETDISKVDVFRNTAISSNYEPGSVMKPMTMSMAINEGLVTPNTIYHDTGPVKYSGYLVRTWNNKYSGDITMTQILELSNNTGAAWVGHQVGFSRFADYVDKFGLGQKTGIDLQGEEQGIVRDPNSWRDIDLANMSFGQGISLTPIQLITAFSSLVNGGKLYKPFVVKEMISKKPSEGGKIIRNQIDTNPIVVTSTIKPFTSEQIRYMLKSVVENGEFKWFVKQAGMDRYEVGGKTGTAQIPVNGRYDPNQTNVTFIGFAPVDEPKFVMVMKLSKPSTSTYSATTVVPLWMATARELMDTFSIPPSDE